MSPENRHGLPGRLGAVPQARHSGGHDGRGGQSDTVPPAPPTVLTREAPRVRLAGSDGGPSQDKGKDSPGLSVLPAATGQSQRAAGRASHPARHMQGRCGTAPGSARAGHSRSLVRPARRRGQVRGALARPPRALRPAPHMAGQASRESSRAGGGGTGGEGALGSAPAGTGASSRIARLRTRSS